MFLPMVLTIIERDKKIFEKCPFKIKEPYLIFLERTSKSVLIDLSKAKEYMRKNNLKVEKRGSDDAFTSYHFFYKGFEEEHNYINPRIRKKGMELIDYYNNKKE